MLQSRQRHSSPIPKPLEVENTRLRDELRDVREEQIQLRHNVERLRLECDHLAEKLEFTKDKGSCPYPHPSYPKKDMTLDTSSKSSISANQSKEQASANRREYISSYLSRSTKSASNNTPLRIPGLSSNLEILHQDVDMGYGDDTHMSPSMSTVRQLAPSTAKQPASPSNPNGTWCRGTMTSSTKKMTSSTTTSRSKMVSITGSIYT